MVCETYFTNHNKSLCSGCSACQQACPFDALEMKPDEEGFMFPSKDINKCTNCGLCERICPFPKPNYTNILKEAYGGYTKDISERKKSSSGALSYVISKAVIEEGGIVYGAFLDENLKVRHIGIDKVNDLWKIRSSKYVQSSNNNVFSQIKKKLDKNRLVYYTGTGCQVAGLKAFLKKDYPNLITSDLVCHGVPPQKLFDEHVRYLETNIANKIVSYSFRDDKHWGGCESIVTKDAQTHVKPSYILSPYLYGFINGLTFRYSCYNCPYAHVPRQGDITLADLWGAKHLAKELNPNNGISLLLINSEKGKLWLEKIKHSIEIKPVDLEAACKWNRNLIYPSEMPDGRKDIFRLINEKGYDYVAKNRFKPSVIAVLNVYTRRYLKQILKSFRII